jgi:hypothetical protein
MWWTYATSFGSDMYALKAMQCPNYLILPVISLIVFTIIHIKTTRAKRIILLLIATTCIGTALHQQPKPTRTYIAWGKHELSCYQRNNRITIIDPGFARRRKTINSWITFSLLPHLAMSYGRQTLETLHVQRCTPSVLHFIETLCKRHMATYILIHGTISSKQRHDIDAIARKTGITIHTKQHIKPAIHAAYVYYAFK